LVGALDELAIECGVQDLRVITGKSLVQNKFGIVALNILCNDAVLFSITYSYWYNMHGEGADSYGNAGTLISSLSPKKRDLLPRRDP
jgi:hypothetical protein